MWWCLRLGLWLMHSGLISQGQKRSSRSSKDYNVIYTCFLSTENPMIVNFKECWNDTWTYQKGKRMSSQETSVLIRFLRRVKKEFKETKKKAVDWWPQNLDVAHWKSGWVNILWWNCPMWSARMKKIWSCIEWYLSNNNKKMYGLVGKMFQGLWVHYKLGQTDMF